MIRNQTFRCGAVLLSLSLWACSDGGIGLAPGESNPEGPGTAPDQAVFEGPVAKAICGPGSQPETTSVQGRVPQADVDSGRSNLGYWCNLEPVSREGESALWQMAWYDDCAYYGISLGSGGVGVVDVSDPENPIRSTTLTTGAMLDPWESLKVTEVRGLLGAVGPSVEGPLNFDVYDVKDSLLGDCTNPALLSAAPVNAVGHEGEWAPDGLTYYGSGFFAPVTTAIDVTDPMAPRPVAYINNGVHGYQLSDDGNRLYSAEFTGPDNQNGLQIWDVSAIQSRELTAGASTDAVVVGEVYWEDGAVAQMTIPITIAGHPYLIFVDEGGAGTPQSPGMARIIDLADETNPVVISKLKNEINMLENADLREEDGGASGFTYQGHYCSVPWRDDPGVVACSYFWQGIRVFDIRDPYQPKEIAYIIPPLDPNDDGRADTASQIRFVPERAEIWYTDQNTGFHVARFTNGVWPFTP